MSEQHDHPLRPRDNNHMALKSVIYMNSMTWLADFLHQLADNSDFSVEELEAQVQKDLKFLLDPSNRPH